MNERRDRQKRPLYRRGPAMHTHLKQQRKERRCLSVSHSSPLSSFPLWLTPSESIDSRREGRQGCRWRSVLQQQQQHCSKAMREEGTRQGNETLQMKSERGAFPLSKHSSSLFPSPISLMEDLSYSYMEILIYPRSPSSSLLNVSSRLSFRCCFWRLLHAHSISPGLLALHAG